jgi:KDO2-lipid IV(A) lauroyltransferase
MGKRDKKRNDYVDYLVFLVVRSLVCVIQSMPLQAAYTFAVCIARLAYLVDKRHRLVAEKNLELAFGNQYTPAQRRKIVLGVYEHFLRMIVEIAFIPRKLHVSNWKTYAKLEGCEDAVKVLLGDRPVIILTAHFGNWEMAGYLLAAIGMKSFAIARDLDNPYLHDFVKRFRQWSGQTILSKNGDMDRIQGVLQSNGLLISVGDQSAGPRGYFVDFFGTPASTHKAIAILSMRYNAPIIVGWAYRDQPGFHYRVGCSTVIDPLDYEAASNPGMAITEDFTRLLEETIRRAPEQYLWLHNRWKHKPPERKATRVAAAA